MALKTKIVCINLQKCTDRKEKIENQLKDISIPYEFFKAIDFKNIKLISNIEKCEIINTIDNKFEIDIDYKKSIQINDENTELKYDPDEYLIDCVKHFGRVHFFKFYGIPYADIVVTNHSDPNKKWFSYKDISIFVDISNFKKELSLPEMACTLSHYHVLKQLINDNDYDSYIILEDDIILNETEDYNLNKVLEHLQFYRNYWDIAFLNEARFCSPNSLYPITDYLNYGIYSSFTGAYSYMVTKETAKKLIEAFDKTINLTMDDFLSRQQQLKMVRLKNPIFEIDTELESLIRNADGTFKL